MSPTWFSQRILQTILCFVTLLYSRSLLITVDLIQLSAVPRLMHICKNTTEEINLERLKNEDNQLTQYIALWLMLSSYSLGTCISLIPAGILCDRKGAKFVIFTGICITMFTASFTSVVMYVKQRWLIFLQRIVLGLGQGAIYPGIACLITKWSPSDKIARACYIIYCGEDFGRFFGISITGFVLSRFHDTAPIPLVCGWISVGCVWMVVFVLFVFSKPSDDRRLSEKERLYLYDEVSEFEEYHIKIPFRAMMVDRAIYGLFFAHSIGFYYLNFLIYSWGLYTYYMILDLEPGLSHFNIILFSTSFLTIAVGTVLSGLLYEFLTRRQIYDQDFLRKTFSVFSIVIPALLAIGHIYIYCGSFTMPVYYICMFTSGMFPNGVTVTTLRISRTFAGTYNGIIHGVSAFASMAGIAIIANAIGKNSLTAWNMAFWMLLGLCLIANTAYLFATDVGERAKWDIIFERRRRKSPYSISEEEMKKHPITEKVNADDPSTSKRVRIQHAKDQT